MDSHEGVDAPKRPVPTDRELDDTEAPEEKIWGAQAWRAIPTDPLAGTPGHSPLSPDPLRD